MTKIMNCIYQSEQKFDTGAEHFFSRHPFLAACAAFIGIPSLLLTAVAVCSFIAVFPIAFLFGWI